MPPSAWNDREVPCHGHFKLAVCPDPCRPPWPAAHRGKLVSLTRRSLSEAPGRPPPTASGRPPGSRSPVLPRAGTRSPGRPRLARRAPVSLRHLVGLIIGHGIPAARGHWHRVTHWQWQWQWHVRAAARASVAPGGLPGDTASVSHGDPVTDRDRGRTGKCALVTDKSKCQVGRKIQLILGLLRASSLAV